MTNLVSDHIPLRAIFMKALDFIFTQYKPIQPRQVITDKTILENITRNPSPVPTSQEELEKALYVDKYFIGWNRVPISLTTYDYSKDRVFSDETKQLQELIRSVLLQEQHLTKVFNYFSEETNNQNNHNFTKTIAQMFKGLFQIMGIEALEAVKPFIENLLLASGTGTPEEYSKIGFAFEIFAGLSRGWKHWKFDDKQKAQEYFISKISEVINTCSPHCVETSIRSSFHYCMFDTDGRRTKHLIDFLVNKINLDSGSLSVQVKLMQLAFFAMVELDWKYSAIMETFFEEKLFSHLAYPYQQIRELISRHLSLIFLKKWKPIRDENGLPKLQKISKSDSLFAQLLKNESVERLSQTVLFDETGSFNIPHFVFNFTQSEPNLDPFIEKKLLPKLQSDFQHLYGEYKKQKSNEQVETSHRGPKTSPEELAFKAFNKTVVEFMGTTMMFGLNITLPYFSGLLPLVLQSFTCSNDTDIALISAGVVARVGSFLMPERFVRNLLSSVLFLEKQLMLHQAATSSRRVRLALCFFIQRFAYRHQFYILEENCEDDFYNHLLIFLKDRSVEVKDIACNTLAGFIKIGSEERANKIAQHFVDLTNQLFVAKKKGEVQQLDANYVTLGLSSLIRAFPYTVPSFIPNVMTKLAKFSSYHKSEGEAVDVQFLNETLKNTFTQFMKTHHERWEEEHKKKFTDDELYVVNQLLYSPVYYA